MKKNNLVLLTLFLFLFSCSNTEVNNKNVKSTLQYKFYIENQNNPKPQIGDVLSVELACIYKDSLLYKSSDNYKDLRIIYNNQGNKSVLQDVFSLMHKDDSIAIILPSDTIRRFLGIESFPIYIPEDDMMQLNIKLLDFMSQSEFKNNMEQIKQRHIENADNLINQYVKNNNINVAPSASGLYYIETKTGNGKNPEFGEKVQIHYIAKFLNGNVIDNSTDTIIEILLGKNQIFPGMEEGIMNMKKAGKASFIVPYDLAFGEEGSSLIPPYTPLLIEVELIDIITKDIVDKERENLSKASIEESKRIFDKYLVDNNLINNKINDGMTYTILSEGYGQLPSKGSKVKVHYIGKLIDGTIFDSSYDRNQPFEFILGKGAVLPGWDIAVSKMKLGEKSEFVMSQELVYKDYSLGLIKPYSNLIYEIELIDIE